MMQTNIATDKQARLEAVLKEAREVRQKSLTQLRSIEGLWRTLCGAVAAIERHAYLDRLDALELEAIQLAEETGVALPSPAPWQNVAEFPDLDGEILEFLEWPGFEREQVLPHPRSVLAPVKSPPAPPAPKASTEFPLTLATLKALAYERKLGSREITPNDLEADLYVKRPQGATPSGSVWQIIRGHVSTQEDVEAVEWILTQKRGEITVLTHGHEYPRLLSIFQRLVVDELPKPTEDEKRTWNKQQFVKIAHARRVG
jgi:hypothetical protein